MRARGFIVNITKDDKIYIRNKFMFCAFTSTKNTYQLNKLYDAIYINYQLEQRFRQINRFEFFV